MSVAGEHFFMGGRIERSRLMKQPETVPPDSPRLAEHSSGPSERGPESRPRRFRERHGIREDPDQRRQKSAS